jgi:7,8-dihydropterin-6-yl-methyl-4-(beta-D-ribofuranosyl)aminobenzene 5'-phosphate synthase
MSGQVALQPVDAADVTILVDNFVDVLMDSSAVARRAPRPPDLFEREKLIAEHGYSLLLTVERDGRRQTLLYDAGIGRDTALHNMDVLDIRPNELRAIVLSHGHADHHGGLEGIVRRYGRMGTPLILHPDALRDRRVVFPSGEELHLPPPRLADLEREAIEVVEERAPSLLVDGAVLVTGQVERVTDFEKGFPPQQARTAGGWEPDPWIWDDQAVVVNVKEQGLVILSSCSHAGAINVIRYARELTGVDAIHAFVGGLHLTGGVMAPLIPRTIDELAVIGPAFVVPGHCTGWQATHALAQRLPEAFIQTSVGTCLHFGGAGEG